MFFDLYFIFVFIEKKKDDFKTRLEKMENAMKEVKGDKDGKEVTLALKKHFYSRKQTKIDIPSCNDSSCRILG